MKKLFAVFCIIVMVFSLSACGSKKAENEELNQIFASYSEKLGSKSCVVMVQKLGGVYDELYDEDGLKVKLDSKAKILDADGKEESISFAGKGSGFLALDKNNDGKINDGSELFGTRSGDGFKDLAAYDNDGNGWIDENDDIWNKLKIMTYDENGKEQLYTLAQAGVGAICLSKVGTEFSQKDENQATSSVIRSTGVFLYENGMAGTVQHLDVAKYKQEA